MWTVERNIVHYNCIGLWLLKRHEKSRFLESEFEQENCLPCNWSSERQKKQRKKTSERAKKKVLLKGKRFCNEVKENRIKMKPTVIHNNSEQKRPSQEQHSADNSNNAANNGNNDSRRFPQFRVSKGNWWEERAAKFFLSCISVFFCSGVFWVANFLFSNNFIRWLFLTFQCTIRQTSLFSVLYSLSID